MQQGSLNQPGQGFGTETYSKSNTLNRSEGIVRLLENEITSQIQPPIRDISTGFAKGLANTIYLESENSLYPDRRSALEYFDNEFLKRELTRVKGNITQYVRDAYATKDPSEINNLRRNVYRQIEKHDLSTLVDNKRPWKQTPLEEKLFPCTQIEPYKVQITLLESLSEYKNVVHPKIYEDLSRKISEKSEMLAEKISAYMPTPENRLNEIMGRTQEIRGYDEARSLFERQVVYDAMIAAGFDKKKAAEYLGDSLRTLNRRIQFLGLDETIKPQSQTNIARIDEFIQRQQKQQEKNATATNNDSEQKKTQQASEIDRFQQLVRNYNAIRENTLQKKERILTSAKKEKSSKTAQ